MTTGECSVEESLLEGHLGITKELLAFQSAEKKYLMGSQQGGINLIKVCCTLNLCQIYFLNCQNLPSQLSNLPSQLPKSTISAVKSTILTFKSTVFNCQIYHLSCLIYHSNCHIYHLNYLIYLN